MEIFLCVPKGFWLNFNNLALPINVLKKKSVTIFPGQKSMPSGVHLWTFQVHLHLQKVLVHPRFLRKLPYSAIGCRGMVFFKQAVLIRSKSLEKNYKINKRVGRGLFATREYAHYIYYVKFFTFVTCKFLAAHIASPTYQYPCLFVTLTKWTNFAATANEAPASWFAYLYLA